MPDSSGFCNLCCRVIERSHKRVLLVKIDVIAEIASLDLSLRSIENKYNCRNCVAKLKKLLIGDQDFPTSKKVCEGSDE